MLVLGELMHYVRDSERAVRAPRRVRELERRCSAAERELWTNLGREPNANELAAYLRVPSEGFREMIRYREEGIPLSVDALRPYEQLSLSYTIDNHLDRVLIESGLERLSTVEREILREIYEYDTPVCEIAQRLGYSRRHITRLHRGITKAQAVRASYQRLNVVLCSVEGRRRKRRADVTYRREWVHADRDDDRGGDHCDTCEHLGPEFYPRARSSPDRSM